MSMARQDGSADTAGTKLGIIEVSPVDADNQWQPPTVIPLETLPSAHWSLKPGTAGPTNEAPSHAGAN
jgi:hypothetical protein